MSAHGCTCLPGDPRPDPGERPEDIVTTDGMDPESARRVLAAARAALAAGIEPGIRRARWIEGWLAGYRASTGSTDATAHEQRPHQNWRNR